PKQLPDENDFGQYERLDQRDSVLEQSVAGLVKQIEPVSGKREKEGSNEKGYDQELLQFMGDSLLRLSAVHVLASLHKVRRRTREDYRQSSAARIVTARYGPVSWSLRYHQPGRHAGAPRTPLFFAIEVRHVDA